MKKSTSNVLIGFLAGAATGAVLGILYAPDKGSHTRKKIKKESERISNYVSENVGEQIDSMKQNINDFVDDLKGRISTLEEDVKEKVAVSQKEAASKVEEKAKQAKKQA